MFATISALSWICWTWKDSIFAHQLGSGLSSSHSSSSQANAQIECSLIEGATSSEDSLLLSEDKFLLSIDAFFALRNVVFALIIF
jgi:hypothetical protein